MSKIKRQDSHESYKITTDWLQDFAQNFNKKSGANVDYLKEYLEKQRKIRKFNSIEEKLDDIKARLGFDLIQKLSSEAIDSKDITATAKIATASDNLEKDKDLMMKILDFAKSVAEKESHLSVIEVLNKLRQVDQFFEFLNKRVDHTKLKDQIRKFLSKNKKADDESPKYHDQSSTSISNLDTNNSEIWNHSQVNK